MGILDTIFGRRQPGPYGPPLGMPPRYPPGPPAYGIPPGMPPNVAVREMGLPSPDMLQRMEMTGAPPPGMPPPPPPPMAPPALPERRQEPKQLLTEDIEAITESVVADKLKVLSKEFENISSWRGKTETNIEKLDKKLKEIGLKINSIEKSMIGRVEQYSRGVSDISAEIKAIQKVFKATMPEFTSRVKELSVLVERVKKKTQVKKKTTKKTKAKPKKKRATRKKKPKSK